MSIEKIKNFNKKMSRPKFAKGGHIKRRKFDSGGIAYNNVAPSVSGPGNPTNNNNTGIGGLAKGLGLSASSANIQPGTNAAQLNTAYTGANNALNAQVGLTNTLTPQAQTGVNAQNTVLQNQLDIARGAGPNPAQAQLAQATGTNVANEAALLAGQRGSNANVGLAGRNIGVAGAGTMQGAAGQAATLEAEQQIAAQNQAAQIANNQINQAQGATTNLNTAQQNEQNILQNANTAQNNAAVGMQSNINNVNSQNNRALLGGITSGIGAVAGLLNEGGEVTPHHGKTKLDFIHKMTKMGMEHFDVGGQIQGNPLVAPAAQPMQMPVAGYSPVSSAGGPQVDSSSSDSTDLGKSFSEGYKGTHKSGDLIGAPEELQASNFEGVQAAHGGQIWDVHPSEHDKYISSHVQNYFAGGGKVPALVSPGEVYLTPEQVEQVKQGADPLKVGQRVPGQAKVKGDSYKNDFVKADLDEGGVVVDRENVGDSKKARKFVLKSVGPKKHLKKPGKR